MSGRFCSVHGGLAVGIGELGEADSVSYTGVEETEDSETG